MAFHSVLSCPHIEGITLGAGEEVDEVAGGASGMSVDRIFDVGDIVCEGQTARVYRMGFIVGSLTRKGARDRMRGTGNKVISDKELIEIGRMAEGE